MHNLFVWEIAEKAFVENSTPVKYSQIFLSARGPKLAVPPIYPVTLSDWNICDDEQNLICQSHDYTWLDNEFLSRDDYSVIWHVRFFQITSRNLGPVREIDKEIPRFQ